MSAETLRRAAEKIRADWSGMRGAAWEREGAFHLAVADWLDAVADHEEYDDIGGHCPDCDDEALAVARAYLGGES